MFTGDLFLSIVLLGQVQVIGLLLSQLGMKHFQRKVPPFLKFSLKTAG